MRRLLIGGALAALALTAYLTLAPCPVEPEPFTPDAPREATGPLAPNDALAKAEVASTGDHIGPEDLLVEDGRVTAGYRGGIVAEIVPAPKVLANTGGRPLGLARDHEGRLLICDADKGLLRLEPDGKLTTLATEAAGRPFRFTNELAVAADGTIYFTDSSDRWPIADYCFEIVEGRSRGRVLKRAPGGEVSVLVDGLHFPNGVALSTDEDALLFCETTRYQVNRFWLKGPKAGTRDVFCARLPGFPDNLSRSPRGTYWVAVFSRRDPLLDMVGPHVWARRCVAKLPRILWENPKPYGMIVELDANGEIVRSLQETTGKHVREVTTAVERDGTLWIGTLKEPRYARLKI
jgi:sugar lactone lactonase YvrE